MATKADRVSRNVRDLLNLSATLEAHGVGLVTADEQFDATTPLGKAMSAMRAVDAGDGQSLRFVGCSPHRFIRLPRCSAVAYVVSGPMPGDGVPRTA